MAKILIVEDDPIVAELAVLVCKAARHIVTCVGHGIEALMLLEALPFDLVLTDLEMPRLDGVGLTRLIRTSEREFARIPIIGMAASRDEADALLAAGVDACTPKPVTVGGLAPLIAQLLAAPPARITVTRAHDTSPLPDAPESY